MTSFPPVCHSAGISCLSALFGEAETRRRLPGVLACQLLLLLELSSDWCPDRVCAPPSNSFMCWLLEMREENSRF